MRAKNPFLIAGYLSPEFFCDREAETKKITDALTNGRNLTLSSIRRIGKTGLIKNVFHHLQKKRNWCVLYVDIMPTENLHDFIKLFTTAIVEQERAQSKNYLKKIAFLLAGMKAKLTFNEITGVPELEIDYRSPKEAEKSLSEIFSYLSQQSMNYAVAIDEFQQITVYPEKNTERLLRSHIQQLNNVRFIFSGSNKHLLTSMFSDYGKPFYQSSDFLYLEKIDTGNYTRFVCDNFRKGGKFIDDLLVKEAIEYYQVHTFYVQYFFNRLYETADKRVTKDMMDHVHEMILEEREYIYYSYRNLLTAYQFHLLKAIACEGGVSKPSASEFITRYHLKQNSSVHRALAALVEKEMVYQENGTYYIYDVFFSKWLARLM